MRQRLQVRRNCQSNMQVLGMIQHRVCGQNRRVAHRAKKTVATTVAADGRQ